jgi:methionyl aminopeptidase
LDRIGAGILNEDGARSAPPLEYGFPGAVCISVNDEALHGIPGPRVIGEGDLVKLDLVAEKNGYYADAAVSVVAGESAGVAGGLTRTAERAFHEAIKVARAGNRVSGIGRIVESEVEGDGYFVLRRYCGHGTGRRIHEAPEVPNYENSNSRARLTEGMILTVEPVISAGTRETKTASDGWTVRTSDGSLAAHYEHTLMITRGEPLLLTTV